MIDEYFNHRHIAYGYATCAGARKEEPDPNYVLHRWNGHAYFKFSNEISPG